MVEKYHLYTIPLFVALWITLGFGFIAEELLPPLLRVKSLLFLLCDFVFFVLGVISLRSRRDLAVFASFLALAVVAAVLNSESPSHVINGIRDFIGLLFIPPIIRHLLNSPNSERFIRSFDRQIFALLIYEAFCVTWQFMRFGAGDWGGGGFGFGGSGMVSTLIYFLSFYLLSKRWDFSRGYLEQLVENKWLIILLYPSFLNETKISFILLIAYFGLLMPLSFKTFMRLVFASPIIAAVLCVLGVIYLNVTNQDSSVMTYEFMESYFVGELDSEEIMNLAIAIQDERSDVADMAGLDVPRFTKLFLAPEALVDTGGGEVLGAGIGHFKGGTTVDVTPFAREFEWLLVGSRPMLFVIFIQLGWCGILWFFFCMGSLLAPKIDDQMAFNTKVYFGLIVLLVCFYNDSFTNPCFCFMVFYVLMRAYLPPKELATSGAEVETAPKPA